MNLHQAFKAAVQKFYEGYNMEHSAKGEEDFPYTFDKLDTLHKEMKMPKKVEPEEDEEIEDLDPEADALEDEMEGENDD